MAFKSITTSVNSIYSEPSRKMLIIAGILSNRSELYEFEINARTPDAKTEREKALITIKLPNGEKWEGNIDMLAKKLKVKKKATNPQS